MDDIADKLPLTPQDAATFLTGPDMPFALDRVEVNGLPLTVWQNTPNSLREVFLATYEKEHNPYLIYLDQRISYREHYHAVCGAADQLANIYNVQKGDRVVLAMRNRPEWVIAFWAVVAIGAVIVPLNAWWQGDELSYGIEDSGATVAILDDRRYEILEPHLSGLNLTTVIVAPDIGAFCPVNAIPFDDLLQNLDLDNLPERSLDPEDNATIFYTSGTSGKPKGALGSHRNICTCIIAIAYASMANELIDGRLPPALTGETRSGVGLISVPFFHVTGCHAILLGTTAGGNALVIMRKWDPEEALRLIEREQVTSFAGVPGMAWQILECPNFDDYDTSSMISLSYGGAPAAPGLRQRFDDKMAGVSPRNGYGMTETSSLVSNITGPVYRDRPDSVGIPIPVNEMKIVDTNGNECPRGIVGELWMYGPNIVKGYWNKPDATAEAFTNGWMHSGDLAKMDDEGYVYIVDRAKDMLIRGGENIYCVEVEDALYTHPDIMDAAIFGRPHDILGEEVVAAVQRIPGSALDGEAMRQHLTDRIAGFKIPVDIFFQDDPLPRNANGKILKPALKEKYL